MSKSADKAKTERSSMLSPIRRKQQPVGLYSRLLQMKEDQTPLIQRRNAEKTNAYAPSTSASAIYPKLDVVDAEDPSEKEADATADQVMASPQTDSDKQTVQTKPLAGAISRSRESEAPYGSTSDKTESYVSGLSGGQPLSRKERDFFEPRFGADFSNVKIHNDSKAHQAAGSINAKAFTTGNNVVFGKGQYSPDSTSGRHLMAHELTHTVQQGKGIHRKTAVGTFSWQIQDSIIGRWHDREIVIYNRTVEEWKEFLKTDADTKEGGIELNLFMAHSLGRGFSSAMTPDHAEDFRNSEFEQSYYQIPNVNVPVQVNPIPLMIALLTVGSEIDLQNRPYEGGGQRWTKDNLLTLLTQFTQTFGAEALTRIDDSEFDSNNIEAFVKEGAASESFGDYSLSGGVANAVMKSAVSATLSQMYQLAILLSENARENLSERNALRYLIQNNGFAIRAALKAIHEIRERDATWTGFVVNVAFGAGSVLISTALQAAITAAAQHWVNEGTQGIVGLRGNQKYSEFVEAFNDSYKVLEDEITNSDIPTKEIIIRELAIAYSWFTNAID